MGTIQDLPHDLVKTIFLSLGMKDVLRSGQVSKEWRAISNEVLDDDLHILDLSFCTEALLPKVRHWIKSRRFDHINELVLRSGAITDDFLHEIAQLPWFSNIRSIAIESRQVTTSLSAIAAACTNLEVLNLESCPKITDDHLIDMSGHLANLKELNISQTFIGERGLSSILSRCKKLETLICRKCSQLTAEAFRTLGAGSREVSNLTHLDLSLCIRVVPEVAIFLKPASRLKTLSIGGLARMQPLAMQMICQNAPGLERLDISNTERLGNAQLIPICRTARHITSLNIAGCANVTCEGLGASVAVLPKLQELNCNKCNIRDNGILALAQAPCAKNLRSLSISWCTHVTSQSMRAFITVAGTSLHSLEMETCWRLDKDFWLDLAQYCPNLERLNVRMCTVTFEDFELLAKSLHHLIRIDVGSVADEAGTIDVVTMFAKVRPKCRVCW
eukprot:TRINITY_DN1200_c0_g1::TRINITY_DN1200_c0_g1_i1::g.17295::m.17295 TRINITY_DN1200_c0_g1::TRINITY_DN1200_c0_g1_i1::g.17295  ORF type:complete len:446 (-),score=23.98,sp/Q9CZV8/FXL20_MOUSE/24.30/4e-20,LRR_6/PF13516.1/1.8e+03,LRR_6/PF13516.1/2.5e+03,LRR_6/PF13516.1/0.073,LRR_6/PF13516.1/0.094,LRR_6/PF13516.1/5.5e+02,LRR_6/PF13516.1/42,LRR_6/PF13516.1/1.5e+04,LRR_6/PF13516.1/1.4e+02,LRR_6/PF13516.1/10,LRR_6/PF13516.1/0.035,LRR_6/PF13516.1/16,LRR_6/PF13516.1/2.1,LRR_4/PF12799.2/1.2e+04,LRR_4/PF12799.2/0